jgi:hypothetical protein
MNKQTIKNLHRFTSTQRLHTITIIQESLYKYCMNVDDGRIMRSWRNCLLCLSQARTWISNVTCCGLFCVQWEGQEVIVRFVDIGRIVDHCFSMNLIADQNQYNLSPDAGKKHVLFPLIYSSYLIQYIYENRQFWRSRQTLPLIS